MECWTVADKVGLARAVATGDPKFYGGGGIGWLDGGEESQRTFCLAVVVRAAKVALNGLL